MTNPTLPQTCAIPGKDIQIWVALDAQIPVDDFAEPSPTNRTVLLTDARGRNLFEVGNRVKLDYQDEQRSASIVDVSETDEGHCRLEVIWDESQPSIDSPTPKIMVTNGNGITYLEQDQHGVTNTLIMTTKQFGTVGLFLAHPNAARLRASDVNLDDVIVEYSKADQQYSISQGSLKLVGNRKVENCGFSGVTLYALPKNRG